MLEKALEIAAWVQKTGVEFNDETYEELMATIEVAQLWDEKAMKQVLMCGGEASRVGIRVCALGKGLICPGPTSRCGCRMVSG